MIWIWASIIILVVFGLIVLIYALRGWGQHIHTARENQDTKIKFKTLKSFVAVAPDRWKLSPSTITYKSIDKRGKLFFFYLGFFDFYKYQIWLDNRKKYKRKQAEAGRTVEFLESVQADIDFYREETKAELKEYIERLGL